MSVASSRRVLGFVFRFSQVGVRKDCIHTYIHMHVCLCVVCVRNPYVQNVFHYSMGLIGFHMSTSITYQPYLTPYKIHTALCAHLTKAKQRHRARRTVTFDQYYT